MREIKFRAWHPEEKKMWADVGTDGCGVVILDTRHMGLQQLKGRPILMQYTGLKDKNGKEIYEGDIVRGVEQIGVVKWEEGDWDRYWTYVVGFAWWLEDFPSGGVEDAQPENIEVIGNIYENPELLEGAIDRD